MSRVGGCQMTFTQPMREKICVALVRHEMKKNGVLLRPDVGWDHPALIESAVEVYGDQVDAVLTTLAEPDEGMVAEGESLASIYLAKPTDEAAIPRIFASMIEHVRRGK